MDVAEHLSSSDRFQRVFVDAAPLTREEPLEPQLTRTDDDDLGQCEVCGQTVWADQDWTAPIGCRTVAHLACG